MNLAKINIEAKKEYQSLSALAAMSFEQGKTYVLQVRGGVVTLCESETQPSDGGFVISNQTPFEYTASGGDLWVQSDRGAVINIAD